MQQSIIQPFDIDSYILNVNPTTNTGGLEFLMLNNLSSSILRGVGAVDFSVLPNYVKIEEALLGLYYYDYDFDDPNGLEIKLNRLTQAALTELGVTWNKYDGSNNWASSGGDFTATNVATQAMPASYGWVEFDVTEQAKYAQANTSKILYWLLKYSDEDAGGDGSSIKFYSSEYVTDTTKCPKLILNWRYREALWMGHA